MAEKIVILNQKKGESSSEIIPEPYFKHKRGYTYITKHTSLTKQLLVVEIGYIKKYPAGKKVDYSYERSDNGQRPYFRTPFPSFKWGKDWYSPNSEGVEKRYIGTEQYDTLKSGELTKKDFYEYTFNLPQCVSDKITQKITIIDTFSNLIDYISKEIDKKENEILCQICSQGGELSDIKKTDDEVYRLAYSFIDKPSNYASYSNSVSHQILNFRFPLPKIEYCDFNLYLEYSSVKFDSRIEINITYCIKGTRYLDYKEYFLDSDNNKTEIIFYQGDIENINEIYNTFELEIKTIRVN